MSATQIQNDNKSVALTRYALLSISAALITIVLKTIAYLLTNSVGLLSDAMESIVNLIGALIALSMLIIAAMPPDDSHMYGHSKAEYFASRDRKSVL
jgi:divalent metal cation (Fe/Co/Zn/Cd) transporter